MFITQTSFFDLTKTRQTSDPKLEQLRPWAALQRLWPIRLTAVNAQLQNCRRAIAGLHLLETLFPQSLDEYGDLAPMNWWDILVDLGQQVEAAGWFPIEWDILDEAWAAWLEHPGGNGDYLATFLHDIPLKLYGFNREPAGIQLFQAEPGLFVEFFPPMELLWGLLNDGAAEISSELFIAAELHNRLDRWDKAAREAAWERLHTIEVNPAAYPESVCWLPALARWACGRSGNPMLDWSYSAYYGQSDSRLSWATDLERAKTAWDEAKPLVEQFHKLMGWCQKSAGPLIFLADFIMEGKNAGQLDWSQVVVETEE